MGSRIIFVAGCPRSGSSWLSQSLAKATGATLVHEPFNWKVYPDRIGYHLKYLPRASADPVYIEFIRDSMRKAAAKSGRLSRHWPWRRYVIKEVHALPTIEYLWEVFRPKIVILLRHPCAVAASWARLKYRPHTALAAILGQEPLIHDHLAPHADHMRSSDDYFFQFGAYWGAVYSILTRIAGDHREWSVVRHEDLCDDPAEKMDALLRQMGERMSAKGRQFLVDNNRPPPAHHGAYSVVRESAKQVDKWKTELTPAQANQVLLGASPFAPLTAFYARHENPMRNPVPVTP